MPRIFHRDPRVTDPRPETAAGPQRGHSAHPPRGGVEFVDHLRTLATSADLLPGADTDGPAKLPAPQGPGVPLAPAVRGRMEAAFDASFADVRVHQDGSAEQLGAHAFTRGSAIHFAAGAYQPTSQSGLALLGHELTHVQQQRAGRVHGPQGAGAALDTDRHLEKEADHLGARAAAGDAVRVPGATGSPRVASAAPVQAKLRYKSQHLTEKSKTTSKLRSSAWKAILRRLDRYHETAKDTAEDIPLLQKLQTACISWIEQHDDEDAVEKTTPKSSMYKDTLRGVVEKLAYLEIPNEIGSLTSGLRSGERTKALGGGSVSDVGITKFNVKSKLDPNKFESQSWVFKDESSQNQAMASVTTGVVPHAKQHPLFGSRAVASSRLDEVLGTNILTKTVFAQRIKNNKMTRGTSAELAKGSSIQQTHTYEEFRKFTTYDEFDYSNGAVQRQLATLQLLDAITGQSDRHAENFLIDRETHTVSGIDNDISFGQKKTEVSGPMAEDDKFQGMPPYIDESIGDKILRVNEKLVRQALRDLLPPQAISATIIRLRKVKQHLRTMKQGQRFLKVNQWGTNTLDEHTDRNSYLGRTKRLSEESKNRARFIPTMDTNKRERFLKLRGKLEVFHVEPAKIANLAKIGTKYPGLESSSPEALAVELRDTLKELRGDFKSSGGEPFFLEIENLIKQHLETN